MEARGKIFAVANHVRVAVGVVIAHNTVSDGNRGVELGLCLIGFTIKLHQSVTGLLVGVSVQIDVEAEIVVALFIDLKRKGCVDLVNIFTDIFFLCRLCHRGCLVRKHGRQIRCKGFLLEGVTLMLIGMTCRTDRSFGNDYLLIRVLVGGNGSDIQNRILGVGLSIDDHNLVCGDAGDHQRADVFAVCVSRRKELAACPDRGVDSGAVYGNVSVFHLIAQKLGGNPESDAMVIGLQIVYTKHVTEIVGVGFGVVALLISKRLEIRLGVVCRCVVFNNGDFIVVEVGNALNFFAVVVIATVLEAANDLVDFVKINCIGISFQMFGREFDVYRTIGQLDHGSSDQTHKTAHLRIEVVGLKNIQSSVYGAAIQNDRGLFLSAIRGIGRRLGLNGTQQSA